MLKVIIAVLLPAMCLAVTTSDPVITSWTRGTGAKVYSSITDVSRIYYDSSYVYIGASSVPSYGIGPWAANPNSPSDQKYIFRLPASPARAANPFDVSLKLGPIGVWSNGMPIFNPYDGFSFANGNVWHRNALVWEGISFDSCLGHPDASGSYHNHVIPKCLFKYNDTTKHSPIIGYALDGYPIYGPYGYTNASDATSAIKRITPSYRTRSITQRQSLANGTTLTSSQYGPDVNTTYALGSFLEDYEYVANLGDLDAYNGRYGKTPDYPNGVYAYFVTVDSTYYPVYPFVIGSNLYGDVRPDAFTFTTAIPGTATKVFDISASTAVEANKLFFFILAVFTAKFFF